MNSITHLAPPFHLVSLEVCRSPVYFDEAEEYGIQLMGPEPMHDPIYHLTLTINNDIPIRNLAGKLKAQYPQSDQRAIIRCRKTLNRWKRDYNYNKGKLSCRLGEGFLNIYDQRTNLPQEVYTLGETEGIIYLACNSVKSVDEIWMNLDDKEKTELCKEEVKEFMAMVTENRLAYEENGRYISLAIPDST